MTRTQTPLHDWLRPHLDALLQEAAGAGFEREATLAVLTDLATSTDYVELPLPTEPDAVRGPWPNRADDGSIHNIPADLDPHRPNWGEPDWGEGNSGHLIPPV